MIKFPPKPGQFKQIGNTDVLGNIWSSFNLNLTENIGRLRITPRGLVVSNSIDLANMKTPVAFKLFATNSSDQHIWAMAGKMFFNAGRPSDAFSEDGRAGTPAVGNGSDMELFNGGLYVVGTTKIMKFNGTVWTEVGTNDGTPQTSCCIFKSRLYFVRNNSQICSIDLADVVSRPTGTPNVTSNTLDISNFGVGGNSANTISCIRASSNRIWIATVDKTSQNYSAGRAAKVFEWDGGTPDANKVYYLDSVGALSLIIKDDIPYVVDADGKLLRYNGSSFVEVARLPVPINTYLRNPTNPVTQQFIHPRGMTIQDGRILMLINNIVDDSTGSILENLPSGVWEYDETMGLYHKFSLSQRKYGNPYQSDYGQNRLGEVGALASAKSTNNSASLNGDLLIGGRYYNDTTLQYYGIFINDTQDLIPKVGYFVTTKIDSQNIEDVWQKAFITHKQLLDVTDRIELKYRIQEVTPTEGEITWTSTTTFTSSLDLGSYEVGDEVEITLGTGSGQIEHITSIVSSGGTYTVALENPVSGAFLSSRARFQKWKKIVEINPNNLYVREFPIANAESSWIQFKCVMYFTGADEVNTLLLVNKTQLPAV